MGNIEEQLAVIRRGTIAVIEEADLLAKLRRGTPLRVKLGVDPTASDLHLGFTVVLRKLRQFQDLGHQAVLIVGSYTAQVGDPSGRDKTRPMITEAEVMRNAELYLPQAGKILDLSKLEVRYNGEWFSTMTFLDVMRLLGKTTAARTLEREDFAQRLAEGRAIHLHEMVYPLMQGYDSVAIKADIELGGNDQTFNLMVGRDLQRDAGQEAQVCITMPLLEGLDGVQKMSKSYGNYVGISDPPADMFGKLMSISDELMWKYYELLTDVSLDEVRTLMAGVNRGTVHPMETKKRLAQTIVEQYHGPEAGQAARDEFARVFSGHNVPADAPEHVLADPAAREFDVVQVLVASGLAPSKSDARRLVAQGGVEVDDVKAGGATCPMPDKAEFIVRAGKRRFLRVKKQG